MLNLILLIVGFFPLLYGANLLVDNASSLAKKLNIPDLVIALTIVSFGTSAPELVVNLTASVADTPQIVLNNILGSNIANILLILGVSSFIYPIIVKDSTKWKEIPLTFLSIAVVFIAANDVFFDKTPSSILSRTDGMLLLAFFMIFLAYNFQLIKENTQTEEIHVKVKPVYLSIILLITGIILLTFGGKFIVSNAVSFAAKLGISERIIALTIISIGTSLPELATSAVAAIKKNSDIAIGNVVGSNIFNVFFILGLSAVVNPIPIPFASNYDIIINISASILLFLFVFIGKKHHIERWQGTIFVLFYCIYISTAIIF
ncbi:MAG: calcium/sodium antiporter [Spirochaetes bacterium]|nr:calcium/sodium antiporter [Spirochaetota bacterium]